MLDAVECLDGDERADVDYKGLISSLKSVKDGILESRSVNALPDKCASHKLHFRQNWSVNIGRFGAATGVMPGALKFVALLPVQPSVSSSF